MFWIRVLIGLSRLLQAYIEYEIYTAKIIAASCRIAYCLHDLYGWIQSYSMFKQQEGRWCGFRWWFRYELSVFKGCILIGLSRFLHTHIAYETENFLLFASFYTVGFNRMPYRNNKMKDDVVFADRFRYEYTMFKVWIFTGLSRLLDTYIALEIVI